MSSKTNKQVEQIVLFVIGGILLYIIVGNLQKKWPGLFGLDDPNGKLLR